MGIANGIYGFTSRTNAGNGKATDYLVVIDGAATAYTLYYISSYGFWNAYTMGEGKIVSANGPIEDVVIQASGIAWDPIINKTPLPIPSEWHNCFPEPEDDNRIPEFTTWAIKNGIISN